MKVGDKITCVDPGDMIRIKLYYTYVVDEINHSDVAIKELNGNGLGWYKKRRFQLITKVDHLEIF